MFNDIEELENEVKNCNRCKLCQNRKNVVFGIDGKYNDEGRLITLEFDDFYFVNCYVKYTCS